MWRSNQQTRWFNQNTCWFIWFNQQTLWLNQRKWFNWKTCAIRGWNTSAYAKKTSHRYVQPMAVLVPFGSVSCRCFLQVPSCHFAAVDMCGCFCDPHHYPLPFSSSSAPFLIQEARVWRLSSFGRRFICCLYIKDFVCMIQTCPQIYIYI
jgi:hypothetical protein